MNICDKQPSKSLEVFINTPKKRIKTCAIRVHEIYQLRYLLENIKTIEGKYAEGKKALFCMLQRLANFKRNAMRFINVCILNNTMNERNYHNV